MPHRRNFALTGPEALILCLGMLFGTLARAHCEAESATRAGPALSLETVAPGVWRVPVASEESKPGNGGWVTQPVLVRDGPRLWLIGSGPTPAQGLRLRCAIESVLHRRVTDIVNTRAHPELALANVAFAGARIWALADVAHAMQEHCPQCLARLQQRIAPPDRATGDDSLRGAAIRVPDRLLGGRTASGNPEDTSGSLGPFRWWAFERAPGQRTLVLAHRPSGWIVAQGLVWPGGVPNLRETSLEPLMDSLHRLSALARSGHFGTAGVLGEQGAPGTAADIDRHLAYLMRLEQLTRAALERGEAEGSTAIDMPAFANAPDHADYHALNRQRVWRELEQAWFK